MGRFVKKINLDPKEIRYMSLADKQECMAEVDKRRNIAWRYSLFFCLGVMLYIMVYSLISTMYTLSAVKLLPEPSAVLFFLPLIVFVPSFFAHSMHGVSVVLTCVAYMLTGLIVIVTGSFVNAWIAPFAFGGAIVYFVLSRTCDMYYALEKEEGFPEFCDIKSMSDSAKEIIERNKEDNEPALHVMTEMAIFMEKAKSEKEDAPAAEEVKTEGNAAPETIVEDNAGVKENALELVDNMLKESRQTNKKRSRKKRKRNN